LYQLDDTRFNEWQLGKMQAWANSINADMAYDVERRNVYISKRGILIFSWEFGKEGLIYLCSIPMTVSEYFEALARLGAAFYQTNEAYRDAILNIADFLKGLHDGLGD
jgi:hypothetical protein